MKNKIIITKILYNQITLFLFILLSSSNIYSQSSNCNFPGWSNYKLFVIDNSVNPSSLTNFPVLIEFNTSTLISSSQMNADGSDIRVSGQCNGTQTFDFWFDDIDNANTRLWVKLPSIAAGSIDSIYVHYGNPSAVSAANGPNVFRYIEDFESGVNPSLIKFKYQPQQEDGALSLKTIDQVSQLKPSSDRNDEQFVYKTSISNFLFENIVTKRSKVNQNANRNSYQKEINNHNNLTKEFKNFFK